MKQKSQDSLEKSHPAWGKAPGLETASSSPTTHVQVKVIRATVGFQMNKIYILNSSYCRSKATAI